MPVLKGIPIQLQQLFSNLLSNAIKFTDMDAMISIIAQNPTEDDIAANPLLGKDIPFIKIVVKDDGYGFEQEYAEQVFKMFKRLDNTPGTGIGLALCKRIAENHKGSITAKSEPGKGAEFNIFLPLIQIV
jgi:signal transduction histidine kinase